MATRLERNSHKEADMPKNKPAQEEPVKELTIMPTAAGDAFAGANLVHTPPPAVLAVPSKGAQNPELSLALAERRVRQFKGVVKLIASEISPEDLFVFAGWKVKTEEELLKLEAYLPLHACQKILAWAGALWLPDKEMIERRDSDDLGSFIEYDLWVDVLTADKREVRVMGSCSTRHPFHGLALTFYGCPACRAPIPYGKECPTHGKVKARKLNAYRPLSDVNRGNVRKHCITNSWNKAVDALGLTPTLRDLKEAGMDIQKIPRANFGGREEEDDKPQSKPTQQAPQKQDRPQTTPAPAQAPPAQSQQAASPLPKAAIPPEPAQPDQLLKGMLEEVKPGSTKPKGDEKPRPFLSLFVTGATVFCFDNKQLQVDTRGVKVEAFILLAQAVGKPVEFRVKQKGKYLNVTGFVRIGDREWDDNYVLVLRRETSREVVGDPVTTQAEPGDAWEASDEDLPENMFNH